MPIWLFDPNIRYSFRWFLSSWWLNQPIWKICASQNGSFPQGSGVKIPKIFETKPPPSFCWLFYVILLGAWPNFPHDPWDGCMFTLLKIPYKSTYIHREIDKGTMDQWVWMSWWFDFLGIFGEDLLMFQINNIPRSQPPFIKMINFRLEDDFQPLLK